MMQKATIQLETLTCPSCLQKIENGVGKLNGVDKESLKAREFRKWISSVVFPSIRKS